MKQGKRTLLGITQLAGVITLAAGCSATVGSQGNANPVTLDIERSSRFVISRFSVSEERGVTSIQGRIRRRDGAGLRVFGVPHLDIEVVDAAGNIQGETHVVSLPWYVGRLPARNVSFVVNIPGELPADTIIRVRYHRGRHNGEATVRGAAICRVLGGSGGRGLRPPLYAYARVTTV